MKAKRNDDGEIEGYEPEPLDDSVMAKQAQIDMAEKLQAMTLRTYLRRLKNGTISDNGLYTLVRLLVSQGCHRAVAGPWSRS